MNRHSGEDIRTYVQSFQISCVCHKPVLPVTTRRANGCHYLANGKLQPTINSAGERNNKSQRTEWRKRRRRWSNSNNRKRLTEGKESKGKNSRIRVTTETETLIIYPNADNGSFVDRVLLRLLIRENSLPRSSQRNYMSN